jgi:aryl-alcohol dehydrogenase-like predicted oxidoreductase
MEYRRLGRTDLAVSAICLGTMTFGKQNSEAEAHAQMDAAVAAGVNFLDTAEAYPVPVARDIQGRTESIIGTWLKSRRNRERIIVATKVLGRTRSMNFLRPGEARLDRRNIESAVDGSLSRLGTDYIDLYQLHWPDRRTNYFGELGYRHDAGDDPVPLEETLGVLADLAKAGKVRHVGVSNETPWGLMRHLELADRGCGPRMVSIQNPYSLVNRTFEVGLAEIAIREDCGLLAYSPLAFGVLTGKYLSGRPANARLTLFPEFTRYTNPRAARATAAYVELARAHGLDPARMAIAYAVGRPFVTSVIIGATTLVQLACDIAGGDLRLSDAVLAGIEEIHRADPNPCP